METNHRNKGCTCIPIVHEATRFTSLTTAISIGRRRRTTRQVAQDRLDLWVRIVLICVDETIVFTRSARGNQGPESLVVALFA